MQLATSLAEDILTEPPFHEDCITVHYWRIFREECLDHFEVLLTLWVGDHRIVAQLQLRADTTLALAVDGRAITLEACHHGIGTALGENGDHLGPIRLIDTDADGAEGIT